MHTYIPRFDLICAELKKFEDSGAIPDLWAKPKS